jgi:DNA repair protein RadD
MNISLRYYQKDAADAFEEYLKTHEKGNGLIVQPTGSGKSFTLAELIRRFTGGFGARILVVSHTRKIVKQDFESTSKLWPEGRKYFGINSAGMGLRATKSKVLFCGIQSVYNKAEDIGDVNLLIIDEAHRCNMQDSVQYKTFIEDLLKINPKMRVCGLTATEYRMGMGYIYGPSSVQLFDDLVYEANTKELIAQGFLARPICTPQKDMIDKTDVRIVGGEYVETDLERVANVGSLIKMQMNQSMIECEDFDSIAVFATTIKHAESIAAELRSRGQSVEVVHSKSIRDQDEQIRKFEEGEIRFLISVDMFVEGFDCPNIQAILDLKPTLSPGRYVQMYGRGFRLCERIGKKDFLVLDFAGNVGEHGPIDMVTPVSRGEAGAPLMKQCDECGASCKASMKKCPYCGWEFPHRDHEEREDKTNATASRLEVISGPRWFNVRNLFCARSERDPVIMAHYYCGEKKFTKQVAITDAEWFNMHLGKDHPSTIDDFFNGGYRSKVKPPSKIYVDEAGDYSSIIKYEF